ncbi:hypothetical protein GQ42DRAFT_109295, partial [Ramicandelaber brevisporus]
SAQCQLCGETVDIIARLLGEKADLQDALDEVNSLLKDVQRAKSASDNSVSHMESRVIELERNIDERIDQITSLEKALRKANDALMDESEKLKQVQELNKRLNGEIEDLTRGLVEEAQEMVRVERIQYADLKQISDQQLRQIEELKNGLSSEQLQSKELKVKIEQMAGELDLKTDELTTARTLIATLQQQLDEAIVSNNVTLLDEFTEFVKSAPATRINKLYTHAFMKHCITEDIEPCLRFGPNPRLSARNVIESISNFSLRIEEIPDDQLQRDSQQQQQQAQQQSQQQQQQQFRLGLSMDEEWCRLDSFCRDKLVTVYEFYSFIRNLRLGHYKDMSIPELYAECTRLRLRMFHVR